MEVLILVFELIGTVAFAISGAITALKKEMDLLGVAILGCTTALGGGIIRDLLLGITPPANLTNFLYAAVAMGTAFVFFIPWVERQLRKSKLHFDQILLVMDAIGLGMFTALGVQTGYAHDPKGSLFLPVFLGVLTGVGGGVLRDMMAGDPPYIFVKHFYATASLIGAAVCVVLLRLEMETIGLIIGTVVVIILRLCAAYYRWKLPKHKLVESAE